MNMDDKLSTVFKKLFDIQLFTDDLSMDTVKRWDSLNQLALIIEIENEFGLKLSVVESIRMTCVREIKKILMEKGI